MDCIEEKRETMEMIKKRLFRSAMQGKWDEVVNIYEEHEEAHTAKITKSGDTALHVAVSDDQVGIVAQLLNVIRSKGKFKEVLETENEQGNTALHLAASMGSARMCMHIAARHPDLNGTRNHDSETPLFLAALNGRKEAFLCLHYICRGEENYSHCRRNDGNTILHCAISEDYFDLAYQIICRYPNLVNSVNEKGLSPLHLLATKRSAFKSGSHIGWFGSIIYHCMCVEELTVETFQPTQEFYEERHPPQYPQNYQTCINICQFPWLLLSEANRGLRGREGEDPKNSYGYQAERQRVESLRARRQSRFPPNYDGCVLFFKTVYKSMLIIFGLGFKPMRKILDKKMKHVWAAQVMDELLCRASLYEYQDNARIPEQSSPKKDAETKPHRILDGEVTSDEEVILESQCLLEGKNKMEKQETPILIAAKSGVVEMVERILELFPVAIHDMDYQKKNIVLLAVEHRQPHVYGLLLKRRVLKDTAVRHVDIDGNSALHLVAKFVYSGPYPFPAVQMQWEIKWYQYVKNSVPRHHFIRYNNEGKTAKEIFTESHQQLASNGGEWLNYISNSCSVVATLITTVSFATTATTPGGIKENSGKPTFERHPGFLIYAVSSLIALAFSVTSVVTFLSILTARRQIKDFDTRLPRKLLLGLTCLFISIGAMLVCFCAAHFFLLKDVLAHNAFTVYALACLPVTIFAIAQFPLYFVLLWSTFQTAPQRRIT